MEEKKTHIKSTWKHSKGGRDNGERPLVSERALRRTRGGAVYLKGLSEVRVFRILNHFGSSDFVPRRLLGVAGVQHAHGIRLGEGVERREVCA